MPSTVTARASLGYIEDVPDCHKQRSWLKLLPTTIFSVLLAASQDWQKTVSVMMTELVTLKSVLPGSSLRIGMENYNVKGDTRSGTSHRLYSSVVSGDASPKSSQVYVTALCNSSQL